MQREKLTLTSIGFEPTKLKILEETAFREQNKYTSKGEIVRIAVDEWLEKKGLINSKKQK